MTTPSPTSTPIVKPSFIEWDGDQQGPPPYTFEGVDEWRFPTIGDYASLEAVADQLLNDPLDGTDVKYRPWRVWDPFQAKWCGVVYVMVLKYDRMRSTPWRDRGYLSQHELCFSIPLNRYDSGVWTGWALFAPYIFVDNPMSMVCGNTVLGYPKARAGFAIGDARPRPYPIVVDALAFREFVPDQPASTEPLLEIGIRDDLESAPADSAMYWPIGPFEALFGQDGIWPMDSGTYSDIHSTLVPATGEGVHVYDAVQLKQIRDAVDPTLAVYRGVLEYRVAVDKWLDDVTLGPVDVEIHDTASWPIAQRLGLSSSFVCPLSYWLRVDCEMDRGELVQRRAIQLRSRSS